jgi:hypothetical protein
VPTANAAFVRLVAEMAGGSLASRLHLRQLPPERREMIETTKRSWWQLSGTERIFRAVVGICFIAPGVQFLKEVLQH